MTETFNENVVIEGAEDTVQLRVQGHTTQDQSLQTWEDSGGDALAQMTGDGRLQVGDDLGFASPDALIEAHREYTSATKPKRAFHALGRIGDTLSNVAQWIVQELEVHGADNLDALQTALRVRAANLNTGTPTSSAEIRAADIEVANDTTAGSAPLSAATGLQVAVTNAAGKTITEAVGLRVKMNNAGTITTPYAIFTEGEGVAHFDDYLEVKRPDSVPGTPAADYMRIYGKADGKLYLKDWNGTEYHLADVDLAGLAEDSTPDPSADYLLTYDASAVANKKVLLAKLRAASVSNADVSATPTHVDFTQAFGIVEDGFHALLADNGSLSTEYLVSFHNGRWHYVALSTATYTALLDYLGGLASNRWTYGFEEASGSYAFAINPAIAFGRNIAINHDFAVAGTWTLPSGVTITGGQAVASGASGNISQTIAVVMTVGLTYRVSFTISGYSAGSATPKLGTTGGTSRSANGTWVENIVAQSNVLILTLAGFTGNIDNFTLERVSIPASSTFPGADVVVDGGMTNTANWPATAGAPTVSIVGGRLRVARNANNNPSVGQSNLTIGRTYRIRASAWSDGNATPRIQDGATVIETGTTSTSQQDFDIRRVATSTGFRLQTMTTTMGEYVEWDNVIIEEVNPLDGRNIGATVNQNSGGLPLLGYLFDGVNDLIDPRGDTLNAVFSPATGRFKVIARVRDASVLSDSTTRYLFRHRVDGNNDFFLRKNTGPSNFTAGFISGGVDKSITFNISTDEDFVVDMVYDTDLKVYLQGVQVGTTQAGLGTWIGNLSAASNAFGSSSASSPTAAWDGYIWLIHHGNAAVTAEQILAEAQLAGVV